MTLKATCRLCGFKFEEASGQDLRVELADHFKPDKHLRRRRELVAETPAKAKDGDPT